MLDLFQPGAYARAGGGNQEIPQFQSQAVKWIAWSLNADNGGGGGTAVWDKARGLWDAAGISNWPWLHVRSMDDLIRLISVAEGENSLAIGLNLEDVNGDELSLQEVAGVVLDYWVLPHNGQVHMATLPWVQNGQGWQYLKFAVAALEFFPDEQVIWPGGVYSQKIAGDCIAHAFAEGLTQITTMLKTKGYSPAEYGESFSVCHSLYTADDISPTQPGWAAWKPIMPCKRLEKEPPMPPKPPLTSKQVPYTGPYSLAEGPHRSRGPTAKALKIAMKRMDQKPFVGKDNAQFDEHYSKALEEALDRTTNAVWNGYGEKRWEAVRGLVTAGGEYALNKAARDLILTDYAQMNALVLPDLGPLWSGGRSLLDQQLTHDTTNIPLFPAFDTAFKAGTTIIAPEDLTIDTKDTSSSPGDACFATGASKIRYWFGHLVSAPTLGTKIAKGAQIGVVLDHSIGGGPHVHCGVNVERLLGQGVSLEWGANGDGPDYTTGAATVREQLERLLV